MIKIVKNFLRLFSPKKVSKTQTLPEICKQTSDEAQWNRLVMQVERQYDRAVKSTEMHKKFYFNRYGKEMPEDICNEILKKKLGLA